MDINALDSRLDGVRYYDHLFRTSYGLYTATDIFYQCISDTFWPWRSDEFIIKACCRSYAKKMKISVEEFVLIDCGELSATPTLSLVGVVKQLLDVFKQAASDEVTIYRLYERGSLDTVWKGHVKNYGKRDDELIALLGRKGITSPVDEEGMKVREYKLRHDGENMIIG